ncbi:hypothetical protein PROFUN_03894 [Planoprotostelium fungivorum]|uniref:Uncharacterized protein n=1 Tax=Planoprotostelium fungivorum TaxID=1890364 RepID=A0A2P6MTM5_9EUKA|nr:hypothetical protein PROFUN_03894 [Planoprotostelium fungivorum]
MRAVYHKGFEVMEQWKEDLPIYGRNNGYPLFVPPRSNSRTSYSGERAIDCTRLNIDRLSASDKGIAYTYRISSNHRVSTTSPVLFKNTKRSFSKLRKCNRAPEPSLTQPCTLLNWSSRLSSNLSDTLWSKGRRNNRVSVSRDKERVWSEGTSEAMGRRNISQVGRLYVPRGEPEQNASCVIHTFTPTSDGTSCIVCQHGHRQQNVADDNLLKQYRKRWDGTIE